MAKKGSAKHVLHQLSDVIKFIVVKLTVNVTAELSADTPKDTGWAASNWIPRIGKRTEEPFGSKEAVNDGAMQAGLAAVTTSYALPQLVHVTNPVYYILQLNDGTHEAHPKFFVETAIAKAIKSVV